MTNHSRILVVDDDTQVRSLIELILNAGSFTDVVCAANADNAYELLDLNNDGSDQSPEFDLVLLDVRMPGIDGIEACAQIRNSRRYRDTPILMVSALNETEALNQAFIAGAHDFLHKPINRMEFLARVQAALRFKREIDRRRAIEAKLVEINANLREGRAEKTSSSLRSGYTGPRGFAMMLQEAAETGDVFGLLGIGVLTNWYPVAEVTSAISEVAAPVGWTFCRHPNGSYFVLVPGADETAIAAFYEDVKEAIAILSTKNPSGIAVEAEFSTGKGMELLSFPSELAALLARRLSRRDKAAQRPEGAI